MEEAEKPNEEEPTPEEVPAEEEPTPSLEEPPTPKLKPKTVRIRKPPKAAAAAATPSIVVPEIDDKFWATLLRTQREAERATKLQRISEFNLL